MRRYKYMYFGDTVEVMATNSLEAWDAAYVKLTRSHGVGPSHFKPYAMRMVEGQSDQSNS